MNAAKLREQFVPSLKSAFAEQFGEEIETYWSPLAGATGGYVTTRAGEDETPFTDEQKSFLAGFEVAWLRAMNVAQGYV
jgi:hypothetical protein